MKQYKLLQPLCAALITNRIDREIFREKYQSDFHYSQDDLQQSKHLVKAMVLELCTIIWDRSRKYLLVPLLLILILECVPNVSTNGYGQIFSVLSILVFALTLSAFSRDYILLEIYRIVAWVAVGLVLIILNPWWTMTGSSLGWTIQVIIATALSVAMMLRHGIGSYFQFQITDHRALAVFMVAILSSFTSLEFAISALINDVGFAELLKPLVDYFRAYGVTFVFASDLILIYCLLSENKQSEKLLQKQLP